MLGYLMTSWHLNICKVVKNDYLKNEKSFSNWNKTFFLVLEVLSFRITKQISKNVAGTTFNGHASFIVTTFWKFPISDDAYFIIFYHNGFCLIYCVHVV